MVEEGQALLEDQLGLLDVLLVVEDAVVEGLGVAGQALGPERADVAGDLGAEALRVGHRGGLVLGVDVDRRGVELEVGAHLLDEEAHDAGTDPIIGSRSNSTLTQREYSPRLSTTVSP